MTLPPTSIAGRPHWSAQSKVVPLRRADGGQLRKLHHARSEFEPSIAYESYIRVAESRQLASLGRQALAGLLREANGSRKEVEVGECSTKLLMTAASL